MLPNCIGAYVGLRGIRKLDLSTLWYPASVRRIPGRRSSIFYSMFFQQSFLLKLDLPYCFYKFKVYLESLKGVWMNFVQKIEFVLEKQIKIRKFQKKN